MTHLRTKLLLPLLLLPLLLPADMIFENGKLNGKLEIAGIAEFETKKVIEPKLMGWGAAILPAKTDWSDSLALVFDLYSIRAGKEKLALTLDSNPTDSEKGNYYIHMLPIDWTGWKTVVIPFSRFQISRKPAGWNRITKINFSPRGYGLNPEKGGRILIDNLRLQKISSKAQVKEEHVNLIPVNPAESIVSLFWDSDLSDFNAWEIQCAKGKAEQKWNVIFDWRGKISFTRKMNLDTSRYDTLTPALSLMPGVKVKLEAETDKGRRSAEYTVPDDQGKTMEFPLELKGASRVMKFTVTADSPEKSKGFFKYVMISDSKRLKDVERQYKDLAKMDFSKYIRPENELIQTFTPGLNLYCEPAKLEKIRTKILGDQNIASGMREKIEKIKRQGEPEKNIRAYASRDRRFSRDRDYIRNDVFNLADAAWLGVISRDPELTRLAARRAIVLAIIPHWGAGMMSSHPGTVYEHRCFSECGAMENLAFTLDFCHDLFTPYGRDLILRVLAERGTGTANFNAWKWNYIYNCNQLAAFSIARIAAYAAMEKSGWFRVKQYTDLAIAELNQSMNSILEPDGGYMEGPSYYQYTFWGALPAYYLYARARGKEFKQLLPRGLKNAPDYTELFFSTDESQGFIPANDGGSGIYAQNSLIFTELFPKSIFGTLCNKYRKLVGPVHAEDRWSWLAGEPEFMKKEPELRNFLKLDSIASAASVRKLNGEILKTAFFCDVKNAGHKHPDAGSFVIEFAGETYAMDSGTADYSSPFSKVLQGEERHNVMVPVMPDGSYGKQLILKGKSLKLNASGDAGTFMASVDLAPCWSGNFKTRTRELRSDSPEELRIIDEYELLNGKEVVFFWLSPFPIDVKEDQVRIIGKRGMLEFKIPAGWTPKTEKLQHIKAPQYRLSLSSDARKGRLELKIKIGKK